MTSFVVSAPDDSRQSLVPMTQKKIISTDEIIAAVCRYRSILFAIRAQPEIGMPIVVYRAAVKGRPSTPTPAEMRGRR